MCIDIDESRSKVFKEKLVTHLKFDYLESKSLKVPRIFNIL